MVRVIQECVLYTNNYSIFYYTPWHMSHISLQTDAEINIQKKLIFHRKHARNKSWPRETQDIKHSNTGSKLFHTRAHAQSPLLNLPESHLNFYRDVFRSSLLWHAINEISVSSHVLPSREVQEKERNFKEWIRVIKQRKRLQVARVEKKRMNKHLTLFFRDNLRWFDLPGANSLHDFQFRSS